MAEGKDFQYLDFEGLSRWACCLCVVTFDLELGQSMECIFPENFTLSDTEKANICYLSFPDSNSGCLGDTQFFFRVRCSGSGCGGSSPDYKFVQLGAQQSLLPDTSHYYGFSYFRQVKDKDSKRGYFQKVDCISIIQLW
jgi:hypothetical protein